METIRKRAFAFGRFAQSLRFGRVFEAHADRPVLVNDLVGAPLHVDQSARVHRAPFDVDRRALRAQMKADRPQREQFLEDGRDEVLARVLLHVVVAPPPVDRAIDRPRRDG